MLTWGRVALAAFGISPLLRSDGQLEAVQLEASWNNWWEGSTSFGFIWLMSKIDPEYFL